MKLPSSSEVLAHLPAPKKMANIVFAILAIAMIATITSGLDLRAIAQDIVGIHAVATTQ